VYYGLNRSGTRIWQMLVQGPITVQAVRDMLVSEYDLEQERCERDLTALLAELRSEGLLEVLPSP
jgi:hypothetical protein